MRRMNFKEFYKKIMISIYKDYDQDKVSYAVASNMIGKYMLVNFYYVDR